MALIMFHDRFFSSFFLFDLARQFALLVPLIGLGPHLRAAAFILRADAIKGLTAVHEL